MKRVEINMNKKEAYKLAELDGIKELKNKIKNIKK